MKVNVTKYMEVVFYDKRSQMSGKITPQPPLPGIKRVNTVKIFGVTLSDDRCVEDHVHAVISATAQTLNTMSTARSRHGGRRKIRVNATVMLRAKFRVNLGYG